MTTTNEKNYTEMTNNDDERIVKCPKCGRNGLMKVYDKFGVCYHRSERTGVYWNVVDKCEMHTTYAEKALKERN